MFTIPRLLVATASLAAVIACFDLPATTARVSCTSADDCTAPQVCTLAKLCGDDDLVAPGPIADLAVDVDVLVPTLSSITLVWTAPGDDGGSAGTAASAYRLRITPAGGEPVESLLRGVVPQNAGARESFVVTPLAEGTGHRFVIIAVDELGNGLDSNEAEGFTAGVVTCALATDCPAGFTCTNEECVAVDVIAPGVISDLAIDLLATTTTTLTVRFSAPGDDGFDGGGAAERYEVIVDDGDPIEVATEPGLAFVPQAIELGGFAQGSRHTIAVVAVDEAGNRSQSLSISGETGGAVCPIDPVTGFKTVRGALLASTEEQLVRLTGCQVVTDTLTIDMTACTLSSSSLSLLDSLQSVGGSLNFLTNALCPDADVDAFPALVSLGELVIIPNQGELLSALRLRALRTVDRDIDVNNTRLVSLSLPALTSARLLIVRDNDELVDLELPALGSGQIVVTGNARLVALPLPSLVDTTEMVIDGPIDLDLPALRGDVEVDDELDLELRFTNVTALRLPLLEAAQALSVVGASVTTLELPRLTSGSITVEALPSLLNLSAPVLVDGSIVIVDAPQLGDVDLPSLAGGSVQIIRATVLTSLALPLLNEVKDLLLNDLPNLDELELPALVNANAVAITNVGLSALSLPLLVGAADGLDGAGGDVSLQQMPALLSVDLPAGAPTWSLIVGDAPVLERITAPEAFGPTSSSRLSLTRVPALDTLDVDDSGSAGELLITNAPLLGSLSIARVSVTLLLDDVGVTSLVIDATNATARVINAASLASASISGASSLFEVAFLNNPVLVTLTTTDRSIVALTDNALLASAQLNRPVDGDLTVVARNNPALDVAGICPTGCDFLDIPDNQCGNLGQAACP
ncbi:MAG: fibronectin type III domain-containing protein [Deltaproteobacteria bacterium]|nr:fibronectin type III domain-containing protein [Deltaproteobacteria bacterium]